MVSLIFQITVTVMNFSNKVQKLTLMGCLIQYCKQCIEDKQAKTLNKMQISG